MVEPGRLEVVAELVREPLVLAEHDAGEHGAPLPVEPRGDRARDMRAEPIRDAADAAAAADDPPVAAVQDDVDAAAREPAALVEAVLRAARRGDRRSQVEDGALRRRAADRKLEQHALAQRALVEATHLGGNAQRERRLAHRPGDDGRDRGRAADLRLEQAAVERVEPHAPPPPAGERERERAGRQARARDDRRDGRGERRRRREHERRRASGVRQRQPETGRDDEQRRPAALDQGDTSVPQLLDRAPGRCRGSRRDRRPSESRRASAR